MFLYVSEGDMFYEMGGLCDFFLYCDLGIVVVIGGQVVVQLVKVNMVLEVGIGWYWYEVNFYIVIMLKGWVCFMYEIEVMLVKVGDCVYQWLGIVYFLFDYLFDMEYLEIVSLVDFKIIDMLVFCEVFVFMFWNN